MTEFWRRFFRRRQDPPYWGRFVVDAHTGEGKGYYSYQSPLTPPHKIRWKCDPEAVVVGTKDGLKVLASRAINSVAYDSQGET